MEAVRRTYRDSSLAPISNPPLDASLRSSSRNQPDENQQPLAVDGEGNSSSQLLADLSGLTDFGSMISGFMDSNSNRSQALSRTSPVGVPGRSPKQLFRVANDGNNGTNDSRSNSNSNSSSPLHRSLQGLKGAAASKVASAASETTLHTKLASANCEAVAKADASPTGGESAISTSLMRMLNMTPLNDLSSFFDSPRNATYFLDTELAGNSSSRREATVAVNASPPAPQLRDAFAASLTNPNGDDKIAAESRSSPAPEQKLFAPRKVSTRSASPNSKRRGSATMPFPNQANLLGNASEDESCSPHEVVATDSVGPAACSPGLLEFDSLEMEMEGLGVFELEELMMTISRRKDEMIAAASEARNDNTGAGSAKETSTQNENRNLDIPIMQRKRAAITRRLSMLTNGKSPMLTNLSFPGASKSLPPLSRGVGSSSIAIEREPSCHLVVRDAKEVVVPQIVVSEAHPAIEVISVEQASPNAAVASSVPVACSSAAPQSTATAPPVVATTVVNEVNPSPVAPRVVTKRSYIVCDKPFSSKYTDMGVVTSVKKKSIVANVCPPAKAKPAEAIDCVVSPETTLSSHATAAEEVCTAPSSTLYSQTAALESDSVCTASSSPPAEIKKGAAVEEGNITQPISITAAACDVPHQSGVFTADRAVSPLCITSPDSHTNLPINLPTAAGDKSCQSEALQGEEPAMAPPEPHTTSLDLSRNSVSNEEEEKCAVKTIADVSIENGDAPATDPFVSSEVQDIARSPRNVDASYSFDDAENILLVKDFSRKVAAIAHEIDLSVIRLSCAPQHLIVAEASPPVESTELAEQPVPSNLRETAEVENETAHMVEKNANQVVQVETESIKSQTEARQNTPKEELKEGHDASQKQTIDSATESAPAAAAQEQEAKEESLDAPLTPISSSLLGDSWMDELADFVSVVHQSSAASSPVKNKGRVSSPVKVDEELSDFDCSGQSTSPPQVRLMDAALNSRANEPSIAVRSSELENVLPARCPTPPPRPHTLAGEGTPPDATRPLHTTPRRYNTVASPIKATLAQPDRVSLLVKAPEATNAEEMVTSPSNEGISQQATFPPANPSSPTNAKARHISDHTAATLQKAFAKRYPNMPVPLSLVKWFAATAAKNTTTSRREHCGADGERSVGLSNDAQPSRDGDGVADGGAGADSPSAAVAEKLIDPFLETYKRFQAATQSAEQSVRRFSEIAERRRKETVAFHSLDETAAESEAPQLPRRDSALMSLHRKRSSGSLTTLGLDGNQAVARRSSSITNSSSAADVDRASATGHALLNRSATVGPSSSSFKQPNQNADRPFRTSVTTVEAPRGSRNSQVQFTEPPQSKATAGGDRLHQGTPPPNWQHSDVTQSRAEASEKKSPNEAAASPKLSDNGRRRSRATSVVVFLPEAAHAEASVVPHNAVADEMKPHPPRAPPSILSPRTLSKDSSDEKEFATEGAVLAREDIARKQSFPNKVVGKSDESALPMTGKQTNGVFLMSSGSTSADDEITQNLKQGRMPAAGRLALRRDSSTKSNITLADAFPAPQSPALRPVNALGNQCELNHGPKPPQSAAKKGVTSPRPHQQVAAQNNVEVSTAPKGNEQSRMVLFQGILMSEAEMRSRIEASKARNEYFKRLALEYLASTGDQKALDNMF